MIALVLSPSLCDPRFSHLKPRIHFLPIVFFHHIVIASLHISKAAS
ncbi:hypothetical protein [Helicobacter canis]|nr:hypothetical protein [Helicobacter canis]